MCSDVPSHLTLWEGEQSAPREELWEEMSKEEYLGEIVLCKGDITFFFICPGKHLANQHYSLMLSGAQLIFSGESPG